MANASTAAIITALASLLWPLLAVAAVIALRGPVRAIAASVGTRGGSVKLGGFEVTVVEAAEQQQVLIADLQLQLGKLQTRLDAMPGTHAGALAPPPPNVLDPFFGPPPSVAGPPVETKRTPAGAAPPPTAPAPMEPIPTRGAGKDSLQSRLPERLDTLRLLWVDGRPEKNAALQEALDGRGARIVNVTSIEAALDALARQDFSAVIGGMSIGGDASAGIELVRRVRELHPINPVLIYCLGRERVRYGVEAVAAGAAYVTSSPSQLLRQIAELND